MNRNTALFFFLTIFFFSCNHTNSSKKKYYRAIKGRDTSFLSITIYEKRFYGEFEMIYGKNGKDSGMVRGQISGDTLIGDYRYISLGGSKSIKPFTVLRKKEKLYLGNAPIATYMGIPFYIKEVPMNFNTGFIFEEITPQ